MKDKIMSIEDACGLIQNGDMLAIGGNVLHRAPMAIIREIVRKRKMNLRIVKTAGAHDIDVLCAGGCVQSVDAGFVSYETTFGLASHYRRAVETGVVKANEHACYTVMCALRAAAYGATFMPVSGLKYGDLIEKNDYFRTVNDPFGGETVTVVKALVPDVAVIHVQECDRKGNARISGPKFDDVLISRASRKVIITTEKIIPENQINTRPESTDIPYFLVDAVVYAPGGAYPCSCHKMYGIDNKALKTFQNMRKPEEFEGYIKECSKKDRVSRKAVY